jgi:uncharacterized protein
MRRFRPDDATTPAPCRCPGLRIVTSTPSRSAPPRIGLFLLLTCLTTGPFWALAIATGDASGGRGAYAVGSMWGPGVAALLTCRIVRQPLRTLGWQWGAWRWQALSYLWPLVACCIAYGCIYATGLAGFPDETATAALRASLGWPHAATWLVIAGWFLLYATTGFVRGLAASLGEEIGWRGFLAPALHDRFGFTGGALLTGLIWAAWHLPILLFSNYDDATPLWFSLPFFFLDVIAMSVILSWVRLRSGSLWSGAIAHGSINLFNQGFFRPLTTAHGPVTAYVIDEAGAVLPLVVLAMAMIAWMGRGSVERR